ncbi:MAG TPA: sugar phosphate isomerase, partial [Porphyromonadaceae bacterium]|nr:sugar phosphate isomerase [Porphyromonadaceae bacterium]
MNFDRRSFLKTSLAGAAMVTAGGTVSAANSLDKLSGGKTSKAQLNISFQEGIAPGDSLKKKLDFMEKHGVVGFEPGGRGLKGRVKEIKDALRGRAIKVSAICAGFDGFILST